MKTDETMVLKFGPWGGPYTRKETVPMRRNPLWFHKQGLTQTASGYGKRLRSDREILYWGRWRRVYVTQYSNAGTAWVVVNRERLIVDEA